MNKPSYDAIVVGTGITGGWAAKELCEKGLKTLVLDRGRMVRHGEYPTAMKDPWELPYGNLPTERDLERQRVAARGGHVTQASKHWFVDDIYDPYTEIQRFDWIRGYHVGGRSLMWDRHCYRWSPMDFEANARDGVGVDWPIRYDDVAQWYDHVESFIGVSGRAEGLPQLPDGKFLPPMDLNCVEDDFRELLSNKFGRTLTMGRVANLTALLPHSPQRGKCQYRNRCIRGCPYGAYFSSNSSTLPAAEQTGNMTLLPHSIAYELIYDGKEGRARGVRVLNAESGTQTEFSARVIFLCASALGSTFILLNSVSDRFPNGFGNDSGELGCNLMDHQIGAGALAVVDGYDDRYYTGRRPASFYLARYRNMQSDKRGYLRGFGYQGIAWRAKADLTLDAALGRALKEKAAEPGPWQILLNGYGEVLPYHDNRVTIDHGRKDRHGLPVLAIDAGFKQNELAMRKDMTNDAVEMMEVAGYRKIKPTDREVGLGLAIHEMGTARMGRDPKTSVLNGWNQVHACKNVFVTDGACMTSSACQNPSLTYMALTARAANHAVDELKRMNL